MKNTYENPRDSIIGGLEETLGKIATYRKWLSKNNPKNTKQLRHEDEKITSISKAIEFIRLCPPAPIQGENK